MILNPDDKIFIDKTHREIFPTPHILHSVTWFAIMKFLLQLLFCSFFVTQTVWSLSVAPIGPIPPTRPNAFCAQLPSQYPFSNEFVRGIWKLNRLYGEFDGAAGISSNCGTLTISDHILSDDLGQLAITKMGPSGVGLISHGRVGKKGDVTQPGRWIVEGSGIFQTISGPFPQTSLIFAGITINESNENEYTTLLYVTCGMLPDGSVGTASVAEIGILNRQGQNVTDAILIHYNRLLVDNGLQGVGYLTEISHENCTL